MMRPHLNLASDLVHRRVMLVRHLKIDYSDDVMHDVTDNLNTKPVHWLDTLNSSHAFVNTSYTAMTPFWSFYIDISVFVSTLFSYFSYYLDAKLVFSSSTFIKFSIRFVVIYLFRTKVIHFHSFQIAKKRWLEFNTVNRPKWKTTNNKKKLLMNLQTIKLHWLTKSPAIIGKKCTRSFKKYSCILKQNTFFSSLSFFVVVAVVAVVMSLKSVSDWLCEHNEQCLTLRLRLN